MRSQEEQEEQGAGGMSPWWAIDHLLLPHTYPVHPFLVVSSWAMSRIRC
jgi:hypothetical protein